MVEQETERYIKLSRLHLKLKIDRIDQLSNGSLIVIDYKTGIAQINHWFGNGLNNLNYLFIVFLALQEISKFCWAGFCTTTFWSIGI